MYRLHEFSIKSKMECIDKALKECPDGHSYILEKKNEFLKNLSRNAIMVNDLW